MKEPRWVPRLVVEAIQLDQIREHGGLGGLRDEALLESALARPRQRWAYKQQPDLARLAAAYAFGLLRNHPFHDGNKRVAFLTMVVFLGLNGYDFVAEDAEVVAVIRGAAAGQSTEDDLVRWIRARMVRHR